jgi:hypothetical protein
MTADDTTISRMYGGIHFLNSCTDGLTAGRALGDFVLQKFQDSTDTAPPVISIASPQNVTLTNATVSGELLLSGAARGLESDLLAL